MNSTKSLRLIGVIGKVVQPWKNLLQTRSCINQRVLSSIVPKAHAESEPANRHNESAESQEDSLFKIIEVEVRSGDPAVLKSYEWFATAAAKHLGITIGECFAPPRARHDRITLLKSVHIYKKHRVQYEIRTYFRHMKFHKLTGSTADTFLEYIQRNLPEGVAMKVTKTVLERMPQPIKALQAAALSSQSSPTPS